MLQHISEPVKQALDGVSFVGALAAFFKYIPDISAVVALIWLLIRVWETDTVQGWFGRKK